MNAIPFICTTCGVQYEPAIVPALKCMICEDERQYINPDGQSWTTMPVVNKHHRNIIERIHENLYAIYTYPSFAIAQRAHLLITPIGNILWDCITNLDASTIDLLNKLGGINAIAISHPHYYSSMVEWSRAFNDAPVYIHAADKQWIAWPDKCINYWEGEEHSLWDGIKLIRCGGHFDGGTILYTPGDNGALLAGDIIQVTPTQRTVSFMYSYPNLIPLPKRDILHIRQSISSLDYQSIYGAFGYYIIGNAKQAVTESITRYLKIFEEQ